MRAWGWSSVIVLTSMGCAAHSGVNRDAGGGGGELDGGGGGLDGGAVTMDGGGAIPDAGTTAPDAGGPMPDAGADARIDRLAFCMGMGPVVTVGDTATMTDTCAGAIASSVFDHAICSCEDTNVVGYLRTRSFDSGVGPSDVAAGAPVGINGNYLTGGYADIGGSFVVAGSGGVEFLGYLKVGGDARFAGDVEALSYIEIARDFWVLGDVENVGVLEVDGDVYQPSGSSLLTIPDIGGSYRRMSFAVDPPCACAPTDLVDIDAIIDDGVLHNDNADVALDPRLLENVVGLGVDITLPCGRYYLTSVGGLGTITVHVPGRTALFIDGDVQALGTFDIDLGPDGELDIFIRGDLLSIGAGSFGDRARPAATRIYVGGAGDVTLVGASEFVGNVYAPHSRITAAIATTVYGSLFGRQIDMPGYLEVNYDRAILGADVDCPPPPPEDGCGCGVGERCPDGGGCVSGMCAACGSDGDCCAPLVCYSDGRCGPLLF